MRIKPLYIIFFFAVFISMFGQSCRKNKDLTSGGVLRFSTDTLAFDTVFTAAGSYTSAIKIFNPQNQDVTVSSVRLQNGTSSLFHLNVDGFAGNNISNLKIAAHDSIYVFATVNINPSDTNTPFIVTDELIATLNGNQFKLPFTAYGQNAHYLVSDTITKATTWLTDKPYVIIHSLSIAPNNTLTIPADCRVYMNQDARIFVFGTLNIDNEGRDSVVFQGDRLDRAYFGYIGYPGEWGGIYFVGSGSGLPGGTGNISNTIFKNCGGGTAYFGAGQLAAAIEVDSGATLNITRSVIENSIGYGILGYQGTITATNCLINTTGAEALAIIQGGKDSITNCTFANYGTPAVTHSSNPTVSILNYFPVGDGTYYPGALDAVLRNCIVWGSLDSEVFADSLGGATARLQLDHCVLKLPTITENFMHLISCVFKDPMFVNTNNGDFHISGTSPAVGAGTTSNLPVYDLDGKVRSGADIGCYQHSP